MLNTPLFKIIFCEVCRIIYLPLCLSACTYLRMSVAVYMSTLAVYVPAWVWVGGWVGLLCPGGWVRVIHH